MQMKAFKVVFAPQAQSFGARINDPKADINGKANKRRPCRTKGTDRN